MTGRQRLKTAGVLSGSVWLRTYDDGVLGLGQRLDIPVFPASHGGFRVSDRRDSGGEGKTPTNAFACLPIHVQNPRFLPRALCVGSVC